MGPRDFNGMYRDNEEEFHLADGTTLRRLEKGEPSKATMCQHNLNVNYSLQASENSLFSATFRLRGNNQPHWDYKGTLYNANDETDVVDMTDRTDQSWTRPSLDLYYQQNLKNKQTLDAAGARVRGGIRGAAANHGQGCRDPQGEQNRAEKKESRP